MASAVLVSHPKEIIMTKSFEVSANAVVFGVFVAESEQGARDLCAIDAGYDSEAHMAEQLGRESELTAVELG